MEAENKVSLRQNHILCSCSIKYSTGVDKSAFANMSKFVVELEQMKKLELEKFVNVTLKKNNHLTKRYFNANFSKKY